MVDELVDENNDVSGNDAWTSLYRTRRASEEGGRSGWNDAAAERSATFFFPPTNASHSLRFVSNTSSSVCPRTCTSKDEPSPSAPRRTKRYSLSVISATASSPPSWFTITSTGPTGSRTSLIAVSSFLWIERRRRRW